MNYDPLPQDSNKKAAGIDFRDKIGVSRKEPERETRKKEEHS